MNQRDKGGESTRKTEGEGEGLGERAEGGLVGKRSGWGREHKVD